MDSFKYFGTKTVTGTRADYVESLCADGDITLNRIKATLSKIKIGDTVKVFVPASDEDSIIPERAEGIIAYIHPKGRYVGINFFAKDGNPEPFMISVFPYSIVA